MKLDKYVVDYVNETQYVGLSLVGNPNYFIEYDKPVVKVEDLRVWLKGVSPLLKPPYKRKFTNITQKKEYTRRYRFHKNGVSDLKRQLLASLGEDGEGK